MDQCGSLPADPNPRNGSCTGAIGSKLYIADGDMGSINTISVTESFDPATQAWATLTNMPQAVTGMRYVVRKRKLTASVAAAIPFRSLVQSSTAANTHAVDAAKQPAPQEIASAGGLADEHTEEHGSLLT